MAAQNSVDFKPAPVPDPVKGWHDMSPPSAEEMARVTGARPRRPHATLPSGPSAAPPRERVHFDQPGDGRVWAVGTTYKASFGDGGFVYVPFFGSQAPRNYPVQFQLRSVRIGGRELALPEGAPVQTENRVQITHGAVCEQYELALDRVEQMFVIDSGMAGDVDLELQVASELVEDSAQPGLQFGNELGSVLYGNAHVVEGSELTAVPTTFDGQRIRIHVAASLRRGDRLVIDPIIQSSTVTPSVLDESQPDIAYDATFDRYLVVWEENWSATDVDIWSEFRNGDGTAAPGSIASIDVGTDNAQHPRVANLNLVDRFLVVYQHFDAITQLWRILGRTRNASGPTGLQFRISEATIAGDCYVPDVGGDPSVLAAADRWLVVWQRNFAANDTDIHGRVVRADTSFATPTLAIENTGGTIHTTPWISQSNGNGATPSPCWLIAYEFRFSATDHDIYGAAISQTGSTLTPSTGIDASTNNDFVPSVSSPATDLGGNIPLFMVGYERVAPISAAIARVLRPTAVGIFLNEFSATNITQAFSLPGRDIRCESDGCRFAVNTGVATRLTTLAVNGNQLVMQEPPQTLPGIPAYVRLVSKRSGGGPRTDYGVVNEDRSFNPFRIMVSAYRGHAPGSDLTRRIMACNGLDIDFDGRSFLGEQLTFTLTNTGSDIPLFAFGSPVPATALLCAQCPIGVNVNTVLLVVGASLPITIPCTAGLVGAQFAVQGLALGSGPCIASLHFSDTIDFTIR